MRKTRERSAAIHTGFEVLMAKHRRGSTHLVLGNKDPHADFGKPSFSLKGLTLRLRLDVGLGFRIKGLERV